MTYLTARRYGLTKVEPSESERQGGWRQVWEHPSGLRAARNPATGRWHVIDGDRINDESFSSSLRAIAGRIDRLVGESRAEHDEWPVHMPAAPEAPIPGRHWYAGCDPDRPRVNPVTGRCEGCGELACATCGRENCPDHQGRSEDGR